MYDMEKVASLFSPHLTPNGCAAQDGNSENHWKVSLTAKAQGGSPAEGGQLVRTGIKEESSLFLVPWTLVTV